MKLHPAAWLAGAVCAASTVRSLRPQGCQSASYKLTSLEEVISAALTPQCAYASSAILGIEFGGVMAFADQWTSTKAPKALNGSGAAPVDNHGWPMSDFFQVRMEHK